MQIIQSLGEQCAACMNSSPKDAASTVAGADGGHSPELHSGVYTQRGGCERTCPHVGGRHYDIGIVGVWSFPNYGSQLTYYALYRVLVDEGYDVLMVERSDYSQHSRPSQTPQLFAQNPYPSYALAPIYPNLASMKELNDKCDTFILGSDVLWHKKSFSYCAMEEFLLAFADADKRKVAYATSFGESALLGSGNDIAKMRYFFKRFHRIMVREQYAVDICRNNFDVSAERVIDPVFLCDPVHYKRLAERSPVVCDAPYLFCYILIRTEQKRAAIENLAKKLGRRVVCVFCYEENKEWTFDGIDYLNLEANECSVEDWLRYMEHCDMLLTDSYHGYCFAMIFRKQIIPMLESTYPYLEKFNSLAELFDLEKPDGLIEKLFTDDVSEIYPMDYSALEKKLAEERTRCKRWLFEALQTEMPAKHDRADLLWDAFGTDMLDMQREIMKLKREINQLKCSGKDVIVFGAGRAFEYVYRGLVEANIKIKFAADNNPDKWGQVLPYGGGIPCISPDALKAVEQPFVVISIENKPIVQKVKAQLKAMGITDVIHASELVNE